MQPHHRRRRAVALVVLLVLAGLAAVLWTSGAAIHTAHRHRPVAVDYLARLRVVAGTGSGSLAADERRAENRAIDRTLAYTPYVRLAGAQHRELALTFDDGPGPYTPEVIAALVRHHVPATFFEVGVLEQYFHASTSQIVARGWAIGDHTEAHAPMSRLPAAEQAAQVLEDADALSRYGARYPRLFRPPYGLWNATTLGLLHQYRMLMVLWSVDTADYRLPGVAAIVHSAVAGARPGAIILLHDGGGNRSQTVAAVPRIIRALRARGYRLVTVPRLLLDNPAPDNQHVAALAGAGG